MIAVPPRPPPPAVAGFSDLRRSADRTRWGADAADVARRQCDWRRAIEGYAAYLERRPNDLGIRLRQIRTYWAAGQVENAEAALQRAIALRPDKEDLRRELAALRAASPFLAQDGDAARRAFHLKDYAKFRREMTLPPPPDQPSQPVAVLLLHGAGPPNPATLTSLDVVASQLSDIAMIDLTDAHADAVLQALPIPLGHCVLVVRSGAVVEPEALPWLLHALETTASGAAYADHDRATDRVPSGRTWFNPVFQAAPHGLELSTVPHPPLVVLFASPPWLNGPSSCRDESYGEVLRTWLVQALSGRGAAHVPLLLSTELVPPQAYGQALVGDSPSPSPSTSPAPAPGIMTGRLLVVIPTRDQARLLAAMVDSLIAHAADIDRLDILVIDNGSDDRTTLDLLAQWALAGKVQVMRVDEPFNWSRLNNLGVSGRTHGIFVFANNDMSMLSPGWDAKLREDLARPGVGAVGARLLYPSGRVQHGGVVMAGFNGAPLHDGLGAERWEKGPLDRWTRRRPVSAVTGAFLAVSRETFEAASGFDEDFVVSCSDIDFCLRVRSIGLSVLYEPDVELIHHESQSRGHADTPTKRERAATELARLHALWGDDALREPARNPNWIAHETRLFHGVRQPSVSKILDWTSTSPRAWTTTPPAGHVRKPDRPTQTTDMP